MDIIIAWVVFWVIVGVVAYIVTDHYEKLKKKKKEELIAQTRRANDRKRQEEKDAQIRKYQEQESRKVVRGLCEIATLSYGEHNELHQADIEEKLRAGKTPTEIILDHNTSLFQKRRANGHVMFGLRSPVWKSFDLIKAVFDQDEAFINSAVPVFIPESVRNRHTYIIGKSGYGKSTLIRALIYQDIKAGRGCALLTPEAETIHDDLLPHIEPKRIPDVVYFNPTDPLNRYHFNPLHLDEGADVDQRVESTFTTLTRLIEADSSPRINQILRNTLYALVEAPDTTLADIPRFLDRENPHFRKSILAGIKDEQTRYFFSNEYEGFPSNAHTPILTRLSAFIRPKKIRNVLCQKGKGLDFRAIMDEGKILLCNLSDGLLGIEASQVLGGLIMSEIQLATVGRADVEAEKRRTFYVYLDEFQSFVSHRNVSFEKLLSRARKYGVPLVLAHQQTGQLPPALVKDLLGNVSTLIAFNLGSEDAHRIAREFKGVEDKTNPALDRILGKYEPFGETALRSTLTETFEPETFTALPVGLACIRTDRQMFRLKVPLEMVNNLFTDQASKTAIIEGSRRTERPEHHPESVPIDGVDERSATEADPFGQDFDAQDIY